MWLLLEACLLPEVTGTIAKCSRTLERKHRWSQSKKIAWPNYPMGRRSYCRGKEFKRWFKDGESSDDWGCTRGLYVFKYRYNLSLMQLWRRHLNTPQWCWNVVCSRYQPHGRAFVHGREKGICHGPDGISISGEYSSISGEYNIIFIVFSPAA